MKTKEIASRPIYDIPVHKQPAYENIEQWRWAKCGVEYPDYSTEKYPVTEKIAENHIEIPVHPGLKEEDIERIVNALKEINF